MPQILVNTPAWNQLDSPFTDHVPQEILGFSATQYRAELGFFYFITMSEVQYTGQLLL